MNEQQRIKDAAEVLSMMEQEHVSAYRLTDEQLAQVRRRRSDPNRKLLTLAEFNERFRRLTGE